MLPRLSFDCVTGMPRWIPRLCMMLMCSLSASLSIGADPIQKGEMAGYLLVPNDKVDTSYDAGFSMYVAAWPLLEEYPGHRFQTGLFGTWMHAHYDTPRSKEEKLYSDIEGGLGWWRDTRFATETPKFIMGGVARGFSAWANGPGAGKGRNWDKPQGKYGVAQLSPWLLWPPDGVNLKQGTSGELFGYGYLPLPLTEPKPTTAGKDVPTGNNCWTLFLNSQNFKGPVAFFTPYFFSQPSLKDAKVAGLFLDTRPSDPNRALQMETQYVPSVQAVDAKGETYARIAPTSFPRAADGESVVVHRVTSYNKHALWDGVEAWFAGGTPVTGEIDSTAAVVHRFPGRGGATWKIYQPRTKREDKVRLAWDSFATPTAPEPHTFGFQWNEELVTKSEDGSLVTLPEYFHLAKDKNGKPQWVVISAADVPSETGLAEYRFTRPVEEPSKPYVTPDAAESCWKTPGPVAGPFYAYPGDGSKVTYYWYRFADQPALLNADLTDAEREALQARVEKLHSTWKTDREYLPPPKIEKLADIDEALLVAPPEGFETGYVPIVTRQEIATPSESTSSNYRVRKPPADMKLDPLYAKYVDASGYPIVSSAKVNDYALKEAAYLIDMMLAHRPDVRKTMVESGSRMIVMAHDELTTDIPEHSHLSPKDYWDARARGLGGSRDEPVCSCGEENLLAFDGDPYSTENILIHEFAHNIHLRGMVNLDEKLTID